jgi:hypothetical protein
MNELAQAERAHAETRERAKGLAAMASLELRTAIEGGPSHAKQLLDYHINLWEVSRDAFAWYLHVQKLREAQGLPPIEQEYQVTPDYGPMPVPDPGTNTITGKAHFYVALLGNLNARNLDQIARCLQELEGWTPDMAA